MSRSFNGSSDFISAGVVLNITGNITLSAWIFCTSFPGIGGNFANIISKGYNGTNDQYNIRLSGENFASSNGSFVTISTFNGSSNSGAEISVTSGTFINKWHHLAGFFNGTNWSVFIDGSSSGQVQTGTSAPNASGRSLYIGAEDLNGSNARFFTGRIADAAIWNIALTQGEISALANGARALTIRPSSLQGYWPLDGLQSLEPDFSGSRLNGTLTGTTLAAGAPLMMFTPRWPQFIPTAASTFSPYWAINKNIFSDGVAT